MHLFWGYNPAVSRLAHATATRAALHRGARLIAVDPRRAGLAAKADPWLRVRPGTDAALARAITHVTIERGWYDEAFVRRWTNGPLLVRSDTGRLLRASELPGGGNAGHFVAWDAVAGRPIVVDPAARGGVDVGDHGALRPAVAEGITDVPAAEIERRPGPLGHRPVAFYTWSGLEQHSGTTQIIRAISVLYA